MNDVGHAVSRRDLLTGAGAIGAALLLPGAATTRTFLQSAREVISVKEFGAVSAPGKDNTTAIQAAVDAAQARGGAVVHIPEIYECGNIIVRGDGIVFHGPGGWLVNGRITIAPGSEGCQIIDLGLIDKTGDNRSYLLNIAGRHSLFRNVSLVKDPVAGGYQMYIRKEAAHCSFEGLRLRGSNGIFIAGHDHVFSDFELENTMKRGVGGDDAFVLKAADSQTYNVEIRDGTVRGYSAIVSIGSEVGTPERSDYTAYVRNISVTNVVADRCTRLAFIKPGALIYDWRNGLVEEVRLTDLRLNDPKGDMFTSGLVLSAGRGAIIRGVHATGITVNARAQSQGVLPTAAVDINIVDRGDPATIEDISIQMSYADPHQGAPNGPRTPGFPVDHIARLEKADPRKGSMENIVLDLEATGSRFGGIYVGAGLDDAIRVRRADLDKVGLNPPSSMGGGGIWSDSRILLESVQVNTPGKILGGKALANAL